MPLLYGSHLTVSTLARTWADAASAPGNRVVVGYPIGDYDPRPCLSVYDGSTGQGTAASLYGTNPYRPAEYSVGMIMFVWDLAYLRAQYGPPVTPVTTVTVNVLFARTNQSKFGDAPLDFAQANDLLACVPPKVTPASSLEILDIIGQPVTSGPIYDQIRRSPSGGVMAWPARPWPSTIGAGGWTLLSSHHITGDTRVYPPIGAGTWKIPVNLETHARDDKLVIVCATRPVFEQDEAACSYWQDPATAWSYSTRESWFVAGLAGSGLDYRTAPLLSGLDQQGRVHFRPSGFGGDQRV